MEKQKGVFNSIPPPREDDRGDNSISDVEPNNTIFLNRGVVNGCGGSIETRFMALIERQKEKPFDWYKQLELDKGYASRIRRGLIIPPEWLRIKIAHHFQTDSSTIWKIPDILSAEKIKEVENG